MALSKIPRDMNIDPGTVVQSAVWRISPISKSTSGSWAVSTTPTISNTYTVEQYTFTKKYSNSSVVLQASGHVDMSDAGSGRPSIVCLHLTSPETLIASGYRHMRYNNDEPFVYTFAGEDTTTGLSKTYRLGCHSSGGPFFFSRTASGTFSNVPFTITLMEIAS